MKNTIITILSCALMISCNKAEFVLEQNAQDQFFIEYKEAILPVVVSGNTLSKTFCILLHGGPGDSGIQSFHHTNTFGSVEEEIAMVYFDQRCAGLAQGNCDPEKLDFLDFVEDIDRLIEFLQLQYGDDISLFLLGHSWGATLGFEYLLSGKYKALIKGAIQSNGSHNLPLLSIEEQKMLVDYADQHIALGNDLATWTAIKNKVAHLDPTEFYDRITIVENCYRTLKPLISAGWVDDVDIQVENKIQTMANSFLTSHNEGNNNKEALYERIMKYNVTDQLKEIDTPIQLMWGRHDPAIPPMIAEIIYEHLEVEDKSLEFFERSHHAPMMHENAAYQTMMMKFIRRLK